MLNVAKLGFVHTIIKAYVGKCISLYQEGLLSLYEYEIYKGEEYKKAEGYIGETLLQSEVNNFTKILVKEGADFSYIVNNLLKSFNIVSVLNQLHCKIPVLLHAIDELLSIFITLRFDQTGNIRKNITFEQVAKITETTALKMEHEWFYTAPQDISTVVRYLEVAAKEANLTGGVMKFISELKRGIPLNQGNQFTIKDVVTADILLNVVLSEENHTKKLDYYRQLREIISEILSLSDYQEEIKDFFIKLPRDGLIKLAHYKDSFLKLLKSDKHLGLQQVGNIILQLVDPHILDLTLSANDRNDSPQEIENFIVAVNAILSNSPANVYSQAEVDNFIKEAQAKNGIVCGNLPDYVRCLKISSIYYHSHPIFYHLLNRLIRINTLSLEQIRKFIQIIASDTTNIVNNDMFTSREFLFNDFRKIILNQIRADFGVDYIICYLLNNHISIEEIGELFSGLLKSHGYCGLYKLLHEEYHLLNTSIQVYCCIKDHISLSVKAFSLSFINQFISEIEKFNPEFWQREYIPGILGMSTAFRCASSDIIIKMLMTLKSELQDCSSYRDIIKHAFAAQQSSSKFWSEFAEFSKCPLRQQAAQQVVNDNYDSKIKTLIELSMNRLINNLACSALTKVVNEQKPSSSICDVELSDNVEKTNVESK